jgi:hypothetical protein
MRVNAHVCRQAYIQKDRDKNTHALGTREYMLHSHTPVWHTYTHKIVDLDTLNPLPQAVSRRECVPTLRRK